MFTYLLSVVVALVLIWCLHYGFEIKKRIKIPIVLGLGLTILDPNIACILFSIIYGYRWLRDSILNESINEKIDNLLVKIKWLSDLYYNQKKENCNCEHYCSCVKK